MKHIFYYLEKNNSRVSIRLMTLTLKELRSIVKGRNIKGYKSMSKNQLINLITVRPAFNLEESIANIIKEPVKIFYIL